MINWKDKPTKIESWNANIDYAMFIDENGNDSKINGIFKSITNNIPINDDDRYFTITGCIFKKKDYQDSTKLLNDLKLKYWNNGCFFDRRKTTNKYVCFHSREIRRHDGAFNDILINHEKFCSDLTDVLEKTNCKIISITIDLYEYIKQGYLNNVYETAFDFLLERYIYATDNNKKGIIMLEARGKEEDKQLLNHIINVLNLGKKNISSKELNDKIVGVYYNPKWNDTYLHTFTGLEIADLFSYPIHQFIKYQKTNSAFEIVKFKIDRYPNFINKGIKIFPQNKR